MLIVSEHTYHEALLCPLVSSGALNVLIANDHGVEGHDTDLRTKPKNRLTSRIIEIIKISLVDGEVIFGRY
jgi:hypothetical protein